MKNLLFIFSLSILVLFSCSSGDDDNNNNQTDSIIGKWKYSEINTFAPGTDLSGTLDLIAYTHRCDTQKDFMEFGADGSAKNVFNDSECFQSVSLGTYFKNGFILSINFDPYVDEMSDTWEILSLTNNSLTITAPNPSPPSDPEEINVFRFIKIE